MDTQQHIIIVLPHSKHVSSLETETDLFVWRGVCDRIVENDGERERWEWDWHRTEGTRTCMWLRCYPLCHRSPTTDLF